MNTKICSKCNTERSISKFYKNRSYKRGLACWCKECIRKYYQKPEYKKYQVEYQAKYYQQNKERIKKQIKKYQQSPERRNYMKNYRKLTRHTNPQIRLNHVISSAIYDSLKGNKNGRHWEDLVGYTLQELKIYLRKQFDLFMTWENHGIYWHIHHIKPISLFNFTSPEDPEFKECWALSNLQPLEAKENIRKGNKFH